MQSYISKNQYLSQTSKSTLNHPTFWGPGFCGYYLHMLDGHWLPPRSVCHPRCRRRPPRIPCVCPGASALRSGGRSVDLRGGLVCHQGLRFGGENADAHRCFLCVFVRCFCIYIYVILYIQYIYVCVYVHIRWKCRNVQCKSSEFNLTSWDVRSVLVELWTKKDLKLLSADLTSHYVSLPSQDDCRIWHQHAPGCLWRVYNIKVNKIYSKQLYIYISKSHAFNMSFCASI